MRIWDVLRDPYRRLIALGSRGLLNWMSDEKYCSLLYKSKLGESPNLRDPKTFNEKLQWLKLNDRNPIYTKMVDKYEMKNYISEKVGSQYVIPTIGIWNKFDDINFDSLPNEFVLKCTHDSGGVVIVRDKAKLNINNAKKIIFSSLKRNYYWLGREWPYKDVKPRIIAEQYLSSIDKDNVLEIKVFCFDGKAKIILVCQGAANGDERTNDYFDLEFNHIPVTGIYPTAKGVIEKPKQLDEVIRIAERLSFGIPQLRVDTYLVEDRIYVGETTFYHCSGLCPFQPKFYDEEFGKLISIPLK